MTKKPWLKSLHGGHSGLYCEHASGKLQDFIEAAIAKGFTSYGVSEHMPRYENKYLFSSEKDKKMSVQDLIDAFDEYVIEIDRLQEEYKDRIEILKGFEIEVISDADYDKAKELKSKHNFDYCVGSVHYVNDEIIDYSRDEFIKQMNKSGGLENLCIEYYKKLTQMIERVEPEVVGHFDLIQKYGYEFGDLDTVQIKREAEKALLKMKDSRSILDINTSLLRKGGKTPYPSQWIVKRAKELGIECCFGDDSHSPQDVGGCFEDAKEYLLQNGIDHISYLTRDSTGVVLKKVKLK